MRTRRPRVPPPRPPAASRPPARPRSAPTSSDRARPQHPYTAERPNRVDQGEAGSRMERSQSEPKKNIAQTVKALGPAAVGLGVAALTAMPASAATFTVKNLNDTGAGSLRDAINQANGAAGADVITFQPGLTGTITLTSGQLAITDSVDVQGPGEAVLTVSGNDASRVFYLYDNAVTLDISISGLTVSHGL